MNTWPLILSLSLTSSVFAGVATLSADIEEISNSEFQIRNGNVTGRAANGLLDASGINGKTTSGQTTGSTTGGGDDEEEEEDDTYDPEDNISRVGRVIETGSGLVALGEEIYTLVQHGKPTVTTDYAPVSVIPRDPATKEPVDLFDLENFSFPIEKNYTVKVKNGVGKEVIHFSYKVIFSYGGSYNGSGKYLTAINVIPSYVKASFGWDFNATMKVSGLMNHGSKADPVAGVMVTIKYQMLNWGSATERNDIIHITGKGQIVNRSISKK